MVKRILILLAVVLLGCHKTVLTFQKDSRSIVFKPNTQEMKSARQGSLVAGYYFVSDPIEFSCPNPKEIPEVKIITGVWDSVIHGLIGGIYSTKTLESFCEKN